MGEDKAFLKFLGMPPEMNGPPVTLAGSMGTDIKLRYRSPFELGWGKMVKFDHDFIGRAALEKEAVAPRRKMVTLVWNPEDVVDVYASQYREGETYGWMDPHPSGSVATAEASCMRTRCSRTAGLSE